MVTNRVFFPQEALDQWLRDNRVDISAGELVIRAEGRRYKVIEAARVLAEVSGTPDLNELVGKVKTVNYLTELGAELLGSSMIIGDNAYDIVTGFVGSPVGTFAEHRRSSIAGDAVAPSTARSDEELLAQYLMQTLE